MRLELDLATAFMRSTRRLSRVNANAVLSVAGIAVGVAVLFLTLSVYDGYVRKMENIIFSIFPHLSVRSASGWLDRQAPAGAPDIAALLADPELVRCRRVCAGERILSQPGTGTAALIADETVLTPAQADEIRTAALGLDGVRDAQPLVLGEGLFTMIATGRQERLRILGVAPDADGALTVPEIARLVPDHALLRALATGQGVLVSEKLAERLGLGPAPSGALALARLEEGGAKGAPMTLAVLASFNLGIHTVADNMIIAPLGQAQQLLGMGDHVSMVGVSLNDPYRASAIGDSLGRLLAEKRMLVLGWLAVVGELFSSLELYRGIILVVLSMSLLITGFNTYNNISILIAERRRQIGIIRALGTGDATLYRIFLTISLLQGLLGTLLGVLLGLALGFVVNDVLNRELAGFLPVQAASIHLRWDAVAGVLLFVSLISAAAALLPARRAVRADILEPLQAD